MNWNTITPVVTFILGLLGKILYDYWQEKRKVRKDCLTTHFEDIKIHVTNRLSEMARGLKIHHNRLLFGSVSPVLEHDAFEDGINFLSFECHFSQRANEWKILKEKALTLSNHVDTCADGPNVVTQKEFEEAQKYVSDNLFFLQREFLDFNQKLTDDVETISKYQIGTVFKYNKKCPICKKF